MKIIRNQGGTEEAIVEIKDITTPDIYNLALRLEPEERASVLECWHLAHDLLGALKEIQPELKRRRPISTKQ